MSDGERFVWQGREWIVQRRLNEQNTALLVWLVPAFKGPPWPTGIEHRAAKEAYRRAMEAAE